MRAFHAAAASSSLPPAFARLLRFAESRRQDPAPSGPLEDFEREARDIFGEALAECVGAEMEKWDIDAPAVLVDHEPCARVGRRPETYSTVAGPIAVTRTQYRRPGGDLVCPMELRVGVIEGWFTPLAGKLAAVVMSELPTRASEQLFVMMGGMVPSRCLLDRTTRALGERWESHRAQFEDELRDGETIPAEAVAAAVSLDGVMVSMRDGERSSKREATRAEGRPTKGPAGYREAGCAAFIYLDADGVPLRTVRFGRMPERGKATLKVQIRAEVEAARRRRPDLLWMKLADGAKDNWTFLDDLLPDAISVVDYFHAVEHLARAFEAAYGERDPDGRAQFARSRHVLRDVANGVDRTIKVLERLLRKKPRSKVIARELGYFRSNRKRMKYAGVRAQNLPIGSGTVEATCKTLATARLKRAGMRWRNPGGQAVLTIRALVQSDRFERAWPLLAETYRAHVELPRGVVRLPRKASAAA